jgi:hypothetical protein
MQLNQLDIGGFRLLEMSFAAASDVLQELLGDNRKKTQDSEGHEQL